MNSIKHAAAPGLYKIVGTLPVERERERVVSHTASRAPLRCSRRTAEESELTHVV